MKIISYIPVALLAVLMIVGYQYASNQATTMRLLVDARSGLGSEPAGMTAVNKDLETEAATIAKTRADALKQNQEAQVMAQKAVEDMEAARRVAEDHKAEMESYKERIADLEARQEEYAAQNEEVLEKLRSIPGLEDADMDSAVAMLDDKIKSGSEEFDAIAKEHEEALAKREELTKAVGELEVDLADKKAANERFWDAYRRNGTEYVIEAVDPQWHFVIFQAGEGSTFYPGDSTPLLVQRNGVHIAALRIVSVSGGKVVAEYDETLLPHGVRIEVGDHVIRKTPVGS